MKLYYAPGACSLVVHIILHEIGLPVTFELVNLKDKKTAAGNDFLAINSKGEVPTLMLDNNEVLTENSVILQYLADQNKRTDLLPAINDFQRYRVLEWVNFITTDIHKGFGPLFSDAVPAELKEKVFIPTIKKKFDLIDKRLNDRQFVITDHFTLADAYLFVMLRWLKAFKIELSTWKNIPDFFARIKSRPAVQKALEEEKLH